MVNLMTMRCNEGKIYLLCNKQGELLDYPKEALELMYHKIPSCCVHYIQFNPRFHKIGDVSLLLIKVVVLPFSITSIRGETTCCFGIPCVGPDAEAFHEAGESPNIR
jgi:hypothetical protein